MSKLERVDTLDTVHQNLWRRKEDQGISEGIFDHHPRACFIVAQIAFWNGALFKTLRYLRVEHWKDIPDSRRNIKGMPADSS